MITDVIQKLTEGADLAEDEARRVMEEIMTGQSTHAQIAAFLMALRMKGETVDELVGFARVMREKATPIWNGVPPETLDTAGTGGDRSGTFNISTAAAFVAAGAGARVAKHGNRSVSSRSGSADVMEALGIDIQMPPEKIRRALEEIGMGFLFAQAFHRSMKHVAPVRSEIKVRTVFNILGPLANPASACFQVIGVNSEKLLELMATAAGRLGVRRVFVVHGTDGLDEISVSSPTEIVECNEGTLNRFVLRPEDLGVAPSPLEAIQGGDAAANAGIVRRVLEGATGPHRDAVLLNAAAAILAAGLAKDLKEGFKVGAEAIDRGAALGKLEQLRALSAA